MQHHNYKIPHHIYPLHDQVLYDLKNKYTIVWQMQVKWYTFKCCQNVYISSHHIMKNISISRWLLGDVSDERLFILFYTKSIFDAYLLIFCLGLYSKKYFILAYVKDILLQNRPKFILTLVYNLWYVLIDNLVFDFRYDLWWEY